MQVQRRTIEKFTERFVILCEGDNDTAFFAALIANRGLPRFQIVSPRDVGLQGGGRPDFAQALTSFWAIPGFKEVVEAVLIVSDNDDNPAQALNEVKAALQKAEPYEFSTPPRRYGVPDQTLQRAGTAPCVVIMMLPWANELGNLETLCLPAARDASSPTYQCLDEFCACTHINGWNSVAKESKMRLRCMIASQHRENPDRGLTFLWRHCPELVPLEHATFNRVAGFLAGFAQFIQQP